MSWYGWARPGASHGGSIGETDAAPGGARSAIAGGAGGAHRVSRAGLRTLPEYPPCGLSQAASNRSGRGSDNG
ncbi:hypothetical protein CO2235_150309 [Cupriavidus oxalaticus]|uniref:Uncharacterized protein n=1 Tax=Cupriavidus oxalaticus TaxID=96344 RepID=A0A375FZW5_9BURK|nr:hypothetical protein CO2235_150309 [Cupriavidus oxalaticus]